ncbi:hypothetical protein KIPB_008698 [Kipferlia bialata]|uniref:Uncharacterized protein n=1 Tax=Kipferlia bialata TaxID=797122 RepID=A0A391NNP8_9EUKA|nr:hypothetical protein KIPB_008698 [Kipferlia bialata]|eukprot:g8698.t1
MFFMFSYIPCGDPLCLTFQLDLVSNSIGDAGVAALGVGLPQLTSLRQLYLSGNAISDMGAMLLSGSLPRMTSLRELYLQNNPIGETAASSLRSIGQQNEGLKVILDTPVVQRVTESESDSVCRHTARHIETEVGVSQRRPAECRDAADVPSFRAVLAQRSTTPVTLDQSPERTVRESEASHTVGVGPVPSYRSVMKK